jgi:hypothetical protein
MAERRKISDAARQFIQTGQVEFSPTGSQAASSNTVPNTETPSASSPDPSANSLRQELLGDDQATESSVRFTVDIPRSLHRRLDQLSIDSGKPKTALVRIMIRRALESIDY